MLNLCRALRQAGADVTVAAAACQWPDRDVQELRGFGARLVTTPFGLGPAGKAHALLTWPWRLRRDYDVLYCIGYGRLHLWMKRFLRPGGVGVYHEIVEAPEGETVAVRVARAMDAVVTNSELIAEPFRAAVPGTPVRTIQAFASAAPIPPPPPRPAVGDRELRVVYLGRLVRHKQPDWLVRDWAALAAPPVGPARLDVYGTDAPNQPMLAELRQFVAAAGLADRVALHGEYHHSQVPDIMRAADVVLLPTLWDSLPLVLIEAMQYGVPVVAMATGGIGELARDNPDVEITPKDQGAFAAGLRRLAGKLRRGEVDARRLHAWVEARYGYAPLAAQWVRALMRPAEFFGLPAGGAVVAGAGGA
jgi:glycosyltransferase involved in cell wall biosynthesis